MARKLFDDRISGPISPLIDVVVNGLAAMFIILMIYIVVVQPAEEIEPLKFLTEVKPAAAIRGQSYVFTFPVAGGYGERKFTLVKDDLPAGIDFDPDTGTIYGVPAVDRTGGIGMIRRFPLEVKVTDQGGNTDTTSATLTLHPVAIPYSPDKTPLEITRQAEVLPPSRVGVVYEVVLGASGGVEPYVWRIVGGRLPPGLDLQGGRIVGAPQAAGLFRFEVEVGHTAGTFVYKGKRYSWSAGAQRRVYHFEVLEKLRHSLHLPVGRVGEPYLGFVLTNGNLPRKRVKWIASVDGIEASHDDGTLRGTPSKPGIFKVSYQISDGLNQLGAGSGELHILPKRPNSSVGPGIFQAWVGEAVRYAIPYRGMHEPVIITALKHLPEGLEIIDGQIVGVPAKTGMVTMSVKAKDSLGNSSTGEVSIRVGPRRTSLTIEVPDVINLVVGRPVRWRPTASGGEGDYNWELQGKLPLRLHFQNGTIEGMLADPGTWSLVVSVRDRITGKSTSRPISFRGVYADETKPRLLTTSIPTAIVGKRFEFAFAAAGGIGIPHFSFKGSLPNGLRFTDTGLSGTPTTAGSSEFEVTVTDEVGQKYGPKRFKLVVEVIDRSHPRVATRALLPAVPGRKYTQVFAAEGGIGQYTWSFTGKLPPDLRFNASGIEGIVDPQAHGAWTITVSVRDEIGQKSAPETLTLWVDAGWPEMVLDDAPLPQALVGFLYDIPLLVHSCWGKCTWSVTGLPEDLRLHNGRIQGIPMRTGKYRLAVTARDERGRQVRGKYTLVVTEVSPIQDSTRGLRPGR